MARLEVPYIPKGSGTKTISFQEAQQFKNKPKKATAVVPRKERKVKVIKTEVEIDDTVYKRTVIIPQKSHYEKCMRKLKKIKVPFQPGAFRY